MTASIKTPTNLTMSPTSNCPLITAGALLRLVAMIVAMLAGAPLARAELRVCNATPSRVGLAVGYQDPRGWTTEGWWNVPAQTCETLLKSQLRSRYIYVYAVDYERGGQWTGTHAMCITSKSFMIRSIKNCEERGHRKVNFFEVDTGDATDWTIRLTDPGKAPAK
jgi:uncharacterized membrane protein